MGIWANLLDLFWPVAAKPAKPEPLPPLDFRAMRVAQPGTIPVPSSASFDTVTNVTWREWPVEQWAPKAERTLRRITGSRGLEEPKRFKGHSRSGVKVRTPLGLFDSMGQAARAHGLGLSTVWRKIDRGEPGWARMPAPRKKWRDLCVAVDTPLGRFASMVEAAVAHGISVQVVSSRVARGTAGWSAVPGQRERVHAGRRVVGPDGTVYAGIRPAARAVGLAPTVVRRKVVAGRDGWRYAD